MTFGLFQAYGELHAGSFAAILRVIFSPIITAWTPRLLQSFTFGHHVDLIQYMTKMDYRPPFKQTAIVGLADGNVGISHDVSLPLLEDDMILVKNEAVALNPVDIKLVGKLCTENAVSGMDFAGTVVALGQNVKAAADIKVGDRVCGAVQGMHSLTPAVGAFAQYVGAGDVVILKLPEHISFEEGASLGSGIATIGLALFQSLELPGTPDNPTDVPRDILVCGGSTATGTIAIQVLKLCVTSPNDTCEQ